MFSIFIFHHLSCIFVDTRNVRIITLFFYSIVPNPTHECNDIMTIMIRQDELASVSSGVYRDSARFSSLSLCRAVDGSESKSSNQTSSCDGCQSGNRGEGMKGSVSFLFL